MFGNILPSRFANAICGPILNVFILAPENELSEIIDIKFEETFCFLNFEGNTFLKIKGLLLLLVNYKWGVHYVFLDALREYFIIYINGC